MLTLSKIGQEKSSTFWILIHALIGVICTINKFPLILWVYVIVLSALPYLLKRSSNYRVLIIYFISYISSLEVLGRLAKTSPFLPYEISKYVLFIFLSIGIFRGNSKGYLGLFMVLLLLPALFIDVSGEVNDYRLVIFNIMGPLNTALAVWFFKDLVINDSEFKVLCRLLILPLISSLIFVYLKTPDFDKIEFSLLANYQTTGGFGPNQVSTILGVGLLISFLFLINKWKLTGYRFTDLMLFLGFSLQGLLTFSRGGMLGGAIGVLVFLFFVSKSNLSGEIRKSVQTVKKYAIPMIVLAIATFLIADNITGGKLSLRYQGETGGTLAGHRQKDLNVLTTNRYDIFIGDLLLWEQHPVFGVGVAASKFVRETVTDVVAHVELSRLLAEHGVLGLIYFILLMITPLTKRKQSDPIFKAILWSFFIVGIFTSFHSAMRTYVTPLFIGLSLIQINRSKP